MHVILYIADMTGETMGPGMGSLVTEKPLVVYAKWDDEAKVWVATSEDVPGLVTEAASLDLLVPKLKLMIPELLDLNGYADSDDIPFKLVSELQEVAHRQAA